VVVLVLVVVRRRRGMKGVDGGCRYNKNDDDDEKPQAML